MTAANIAVEIVGWIGAALILMAYLLLSMGKLLGLVAVLGAAAVAAVPVWFITKSEAFAALAACPVLLAGGAALVPLVSAAFRRFDVGRDTPG